MSKDKQPSQAEQAHVLECEGLRLDLTKQEVQVCGQCYHLTPLECRLLATLMQHSGETLTSEFLMRAVWDTEFTGDIRTLYVHISWLRSKIEQDPGDPRIIRTIRGVGYLFDFA